MFMMYSFTKFYVFELPKIFEYLVVERRNGNNFDYSFFMKMLDGKYKMA